MRNQSSLVLLIEDNPDHADLIKSCLLLHPQVREVVRLADGDQALDFLSDHRSDTATSAGTRCIPNLILLDLRLPKVDGLEVLRRFRIDEQFAGTPIVVLSSSHAKQDIEEAYRLGADAYAVKPLDYGKLQQMIFTTCSFWFAWNDARLAEMTV